MPDSSGSNKNQEANAKNVDIEYIEKNNSKLENLNEQELSKLLSSNPSDN